MASLLLFLRSLRDLISTVQTCVVICHLLIVRTCSKGAGTFRDTCWDRPDGLPPKDIKTTLVGTIDLWIWG